MKLPFLNREEELSRLEALLARDHGSLAVIYGRRRCGKSRLLREALHREQTVYFVGDDRESSMQKLGLAAEIGRKLPDFDRVEYPEWDALLSRWWSEAPRGYSLILDEFPSMVASAPELPSLLQKYVDAAGKRSPHLILTGSSQRMMQGLALDRSAPLFGRAQEILRILPLGAGWIQKALRIHDANHAIEAFAVWGGIPRYWELARDHDDLKTAIRTLVLSPLGVLHEEPQRLLLDDLRDTTQAASILALIGRGCHRPSEIAGRLGKPATSLSRPLQNLIELDLVRRDIPFGTSARNPKRTLYQISDPFLRFWFRFVEPNRSRLEAREIAPVSSEVMRNLPRHVSGVWEELSRASIVPLRCFGSDWNMPRRWWGTGTDRKPMELDIVAESQDGSTILFGEVKWSKSVNVERELDLLREKSARFPGVGRRAVQHALWIGGGDTKVRDSRVFTPAQVLAAMR